MILHRCLIGVVFLHICVIHGVYSSSSLVSAPSSSPSCHHFTPEKCGTLDIPYPFSLRNSTDCPPVRSSFQLSCDASKTSLELGFAQFEVLRFSPGGITINPGNCSRLNLHSFNLSMTRFTLSPDNLLLLHNCTTTCPANHTSCLPTDNSACNFNVSTCCQILNESEPTPRDVYSNASMEAFTQGFLNLANFSTKFHCSTFTSWVYNSSSTTFNADYGLKLNWSIQGSCSSNPCSENAICNHELQGYFCECKPGFEGDGYVDGAGCTIPVPASPPTSCDNCNLPSVPAASQNPRNILKTAIITAGIIALATIVAAVVVACAVMKSRSSSALQDAKKSDSRCLADLLTFGQSETFTFKQLEKATKGFASSGMLGNGACGIVYAGTLDDNRRVAGKRIHYLSEPSYHHHDACKLDNHH